MPPRTHRHSNLIGTCSTAAAIHRGPKPSHGRVLRSALVPYTAVVMCRATDLPHRSPQLTAALPTFVGTPCWYILLSYIWLCTRLCQPLNLRAQPAMETRHDRAVHTSRGEVTSKLLQREAKLSMYEEGRRLSAGPLHPAAPKVRQSTFPSFGLRASALCSLRLVPLLRALANPQSVLDRPMPCRCLAALRCLSEARCWLGHGPMDRGRVQLAQAQGWGTFGGGAGGRGGGGQGGRSMLLRFPCLIGADWRGEGSAFLLGCAWPVRARRPRVQLMGSSWVKLPE